VRCLPILEAYRNPNYWVLAFHNQLAAHHVKRVDILKLDTYANKFDKLISYRFPSVMKVHSALQSPKNRSELIILLKSWLENHTFSAHTLNMVTGQCVPLPSFPDRGEKLLCAAKDKLIVVTKLPVPALHYLNYNTMTWENIVLPQALVSWFGATAVTIPDDTFYLFGAMRIDNFEDGEASLVYSYDCDSNTLKKAGELSRHRSSPTCCLWGDKIVVSGGIWHELQGTISAETYCPSTKKTEALPNIPIHIGYNFDICQYRTGLLAMAGYVLYHQYGIFYFDPDRYEWQPMYHLFQLKRPRISTMLSCKVQGLECAQGLSNTSGKYLNFLPNGRLEEKYDLSRRRQKSAISTVRARREGPLAQVLPDAYLGALSLLLYCFLLCHGFQ